VGIPAAQGPDPSLITVSLITVSLITVSLITVSLITVSLITVRRRTRPCRTLIVIGQPVELLEASASAGHLGNNVDQH
jgi:hypothetical protein